MSKKQKRKIKNLIGNLIRISIIGGIICALFINIFKAQETQWSKYDLANMIGDFEDSYLIEQSKGTEIWIVEKDDEKYIVEIVGDVLKRYEEI